MEDALITERQKREREYYDSYGSHLAEKDEISFEPIMGHDSRPWNPYWRVFERAKDLYVPGARLLDFGCGWGTNTIVFAKIGYRVDAFDISPKNIATTNDLARRYGLSDRIETRVSTAESLPYDDGAFDAVIGVDILHHVDIAASITEVRRILRPGGYAIFREPIEQPVFDRLRNTRIVRSFRPNSVSVDHHITEDERKLSAADIATIRGIFPSLTIESYRILSRLDVLMPGQLNRLEKIDLWLRSMPGYGWWRGTGIMYMRKQD